MDRTVIAVFKSLTQAMEAIREIAETKAASNGISLVLPRQNEALDWETAAELDGGAAPQPADPFAGLLVGVNSIDLPGVGPVTAAGPLAGALAREPGKGLADCLVNAGLTPDRAAYYEQQVGRGMVLAAIRTDNAKSSRVANFLSAFGGRDVEKWSKTLNHSLKPRK